MLRELDDEGVSGLIALLHSINAASSHAARNLLAVAPEGTALLLQARVWCSNQRGYWDSGCVVQAATCWPSAPEGNALLVGLDRNEKEL